MGMLLCGKRFFELTGQIKQIHTFPLFAKSLEFVDRLGRKRAPRVDSHETRAFQSIHCNRIILRNDISDFMIITHYRGAS